ncbi:MAG: hypothetical protein ACI9RP_002463, partial [Cyclobacteriaceae bacterium]
MRIITKIDKYQIELISFIKTEVLNTHDEITHRWRELNRGMTLGNLYKQAIQIRFETEEGDMMETETTIWAVTEKNVVLKNGILI